MGRNLGCLGKKEAFHHFDSAYQGFASGDLEKDAYPIRKAIDSKVITSPIIICQSFAKNVGMYGERVGAIHVIPSTVESNDSLNRAIKSQLNRIIRSELSNPPAYGSKIVATILNDPELYSQWRKDLVTMSSRIGEMKYIEKQIGKFRNPRYLESHN